MTGAKHLAARARGLAAIVTAAVSFAASPAQAQNGALTIEINSLSPIETTGCRLTFVLTNGTDVSLSNMAYQVGIFDADGIVTGGLLIMPFGAIDAARTRIVLFDLTDRSCPDISRILLNGVDTCTAAGTGTASDICAAALATRSREEGVALIH